MARSKDAKNTLGELDAKAVTRLVGAASDIALVLDDEGTIIEVLTQRDELGARGNREWLGRPWVQTVTIESRQKVEALLRDAQAAADAAVGRWRQVNHPGKDGDDLPLLYSTMRMVRDDGRGGKGRIVAFGRDMRDSVALQRRLIESQQAMERDYWRYREAETRYRHLFETTAEAVLIVDGSTQKVLEVNPAARALCGTRRARLVGAPLAALFEPPHAERLQNLVAAARTVTRQDALRAQLAGGGGEVVVSASVFRQDDAAFVLVRLAPVQAEAPASRPRSIGLAPAPAEFGAEAMLQAYLRNSPDGLVFCDAAGQVLLANRAFVALAQLNSEEQVRGQPLDRWVGRTGVELGVLIATLRQRGSVGLFVTTMRGEYGGSSEVEISAAALQLGDDTVLAFAVRDIERRMKPESKAASLTMPRSAAELTELVGRTPLKAIVSETTDLIEQLCIQTALGMTGDNRASAALLLGLSRQSLYVKLRRYGMVSAGVDEDES